MKRSVPYHVEKQVPYHGAQPVMDLVRRVIQDSPIAGRRMMSAGLMVSLLIEEGLPEAMANRLFSQVINLSHLVARRGAARAHPPPSFQGQKVGFGYHGN